MIEDEAGQSSSEYILLFGAIIVVAILALVIYRSYFQRSTLNSAQDTAEVRNNTDTGDTGGGGAPPVNNSSEPPVPPSVP